MPSSVIHHFAYDPAARRLTITFQTGRRYVYRAVPPDIPAGLAQAASQGEYFNARIRDHFACERLRS
jgi:lysyl-tRNA synthetase class 2